MNALRNISFPKAVAMAMCLLLQTAHGKFIVSRVTVPGDIFEDNVCSKIPKDYEFLLDVEDFQRVVKRQFQDHARVRFADYYGFEESELAATLPDVVDACPDTELDVKVWR